MSILSNVVKLTCLLTSLFVGDAQRPSFWRPSSCDESAFLDVSRAKEFSRLPRR